MATVPQQSWEATVADAPREVHLPQHHARRYLTPCKDDAGNVLSERYILASSVEQDRRDALRYRWLTTDNDPSGLAASFRTWLRESWQMRVKDLHAAIDAALAGGET